MRVTEWAADQRLLSFEEVVAASQPATFCAFGDHLLFVDGVIYAFPRSPRPRDLAHPGRVPGAYVVTNPVGIEFGWQHLDLCTCPLCVDMLQTAVA